MFSIHGKWKITVSNNIVVQWFGGAWNEEAIIQYVKEFRQKTSPLIGEQWAILSFFDEWELGVPGIEPIVAEHCAWFIKNGCIKDCHVYKPSALKAEQLEKMIPYSEPGYERRVFVSYDDAYAWLQSHQFKLDNPEILNLFGELKM